MGQGQPLLGHAYVLGLGRSGGIRMTLYSKSSLHTWLHNPRPESTSIDFSLVCTVEAKEGVDTVF